MDSHEFSHVLAAARRGTPSAWSRLYDVVAPVVYSYLREQSLEDPDDVAGETLLQVARDIDRFDGTEHQFRSWALSIAHHRMIDATRARRVRPCDPRPTEELPEGRAEDETPRAALARDGWRGIEDHLAGLTEEQRSVVVLRVVGELSLSETAAVLGHTVGGVKALQHRAFAALRERLSPTRNSHKAASAHSA